MSNLKNKTNLIVICGPTASGKTSLGVSIAQKIGGEIISVDSRQVYRMMDIGTGKDLEEYNTPKGSVPYHLIDIVDPNEIFTLYKFQIAFYKAFNEISKRNVTPVAVGGTGLYLEAVLKHYSIPNVPENRELRKKLDEKEKTFLAVFLSKIDPQRFNMTDCNSKRRIIRAIEVSLAMKKDEPTPELINSPKFNPLVFCINLPRELVKKRIEERLYKRIEQGLIAEVERLLKLNIPDERFALFGMEYHYVGKYLKGEMPYQHMINSLKHAIFRLQKRQMTYFRGMEHRGIPIKWIDNNSPSSIIPFL